MNQKNPALTGVCALIVVAVIAVAAWQFNESPDVEELTLGDTSATQEAPLEPTESETTQPDTKTQEPATEHQYTNGTYTQTGQYTSPAGAESVVITLAIENDVVTRATFKGEAVHPTSKIVQAKFAAGFETEVIGKPIDTLSLGVVNGSSLTPKGFNDAVTKIKAEARS